MNATKRRKTPTVNIGTVPIGSRHPVVIQSMTNTPTADIPATLAQAIELIEAGAELIRLTVNDEAAARAVPQIIDQLRGKGYATPVVGDFHYNGHLLLSHFPLLAQSLDKYRINPGNIGKGKKQDENFAAFVRAALQFKKPIRIGVNSGSLDKDLFAALLDQNARRKNPLAPEEVLCRAMVKSALDSAAYCLRLGMKKDQIILSAKMSSLESTVTVYEELASQSDFVLHLGLTEAGAGLQGIVSSAAALAILLQKGIGDTIRVSLTPQPGVKRTQEIEVCRQLLQSLGLRIFAPKIISCPGCGRTDNIYFQNLAEDVRRYIESKAPDWKRIYPGYERLTIAIMGCVVNGPGESRHADIGLSLPGNLEKPVTPVYIGGKQTALLKGPDIQQQFFSILENYLKERFKKH